MRLCILGLWGFCGTALTSVSLYYSIIVSVSSLASCEIIVRTKFISDLYTEQTNDADFDLIIKIYMSATSCLHIKEYI